MAGAPGIGGLARPSSRPIDTVPLAAAATVALAEAVAASITTADATFDVVAGAVAVATPVVARAVPPATAGAGASTQLQPIKQKPRKIEKKRRPITL